MKYVPLCKARNGETEERRDDVDRRAMYELHHAMFIHSNHCFHSTTNQTRSNSDNRLLHSVSVCVCRSVLYVCVCVSILYMCMSPGMCVHVYARVCQCERSCTYTHLYMYMYIYVHMYMYMYMYM